MLHIQPIPAFDDNYIWLLHNGHDAVVVDPGDAAPVLLTLKKLELRLSTILITHHHFDHIDGVVALIEQFEPTVYAPQYEHFNFEHNTLKEGDALHLPELNLHFNVMWLPGHTLGHIAYVNEEMMFCGDVLFGAGCGRLFEGTPAQMFRSLNRLKQLNAVTKIYCTHEYTAKNISFALTLEPENEALIERARAVSALRANHLPTLPSTLALELETNPYLRCHQSAIFKNSHAKSTAPLAVFTAIRTLRNHY